MKQLRWYVMGWALCLIGGAFAETKGEIRKEEFPRIQEAVPNYRNLLLNPSPTAKARVFEQLSQARPKIPKEELLRFLQPLLNDSNTTIRYKALHTLLQAHYWDLNQKDLPRSIYMSDVGEIDFQDPKLEEQLRTQLLAGDAEGGWAAVAVSAKGEKWLVPELKGLLKDENSFARFEAARTLLKFGIEQEAVEALKGLCDTYEHYYTVRSMSVLAARGHPKYLGTMVDFLGKLEEMGFGDSRPNLPGTYDLLMEELHGITGVAHPNAATWKKWWEENKKDWLKNRDALVPPPPAYVDPSPYPEKLDPDVEMPLHKE